MKRKSQSKGGRKARLESRQLLFRNMFVGLGHKPERMLSERKVILQRCFDEEQTAELVKILSDGRLDFELDEDAPIVDAYSPHRPIAGEWLIKVAPTDLAKAHRLLDAYAEQQFAGLPTDYHLFSFSDAELFEVLTRPDEWGWFDYALARRLLAERGQVVSAEQVENYRLERQQALARPRRESVVWLILGYLLALTGPLGMVSGWVLWQQRTTLPNGQRIWAYTSSHRWHGRVIFGLGTLVFIGILLARLGWLSAFPLRNEARTSNQTPPAAYTPPFHYAHFAMA